MAKKTVLVHPVFSDQTKEFDTKSEAKDWIEQGWREESEVIEEGLPDTEPVQEGVN